MPALPPVADTEGGSRAGYARWEAFKRGGLRVIYYWHVPGSIILL